MNADERVQMYIGRLIVENAILLAQIEALQAQLQTAQDTGGEQRE